MAKDLKEQIEIMTHYLNGGEVEFKQKIEDDTKWRLACPNWNWDYYNYRIKKPNVTIEKWLCRDEYKEYVIIEAVDINTYNALEKVKLIESYEIEL